jgi:hypothetical protein
MNADQERFGGRPRVAKSKPLSTRINADQRGSTRINADQEEISALSAKIRVDPRPDVSCSILSHPH